MDLSLEDHSEEGSLVPQILVILPQPDDRGYNSCDCEDLDSCGQANNLA